MIKELIIDQHIIKVGERKRFNLEVAKLYDFTEMNIPIEVIRGKEEGPILFVCACIHGDEICGSEIIKRLLKHKILNKIKGTLIAIPIINVFGFNNKSRYLPDRRDLNRCFPGSKDGSLASQLAYKFINEIVKKCTHGIDLHSGAIHRTNIPQIRGCLNNPESRKMADSFQVPIMIHSNLRDGSLREAARTLNIPMVLFEGGEALRFNENVINVGLKGIISVMHNIGMLNPITKKKNSHETLFAKSSYWIRAPHSGTIVMKTKLGDHVESGQLIGTISDPFGQHHFEVKSHQNGIVIGLTTMPLLNKGDAIAHIAKTQDHFDSEEHFEDTLDEIDRSL